MARRAFRGLPGQSVRPEGTRAVLRNLPEECAVAMVFDGSTQAVMMASPADIEDFALGFALSEGIVETPTQIESFEEVAHDEGIEARIWLATDRADALKARRRAMAGPVGCGLCGIDSLDAAMRELPKVGGQDLRLTPAEVAGATEALAAMQPLYDQTRATHAAGFLQPGRGIVMAREDVGRHNALDKLTGAMARAGRPLSPGFVLSTARCSYEIVEKAVRGGATALVTISLPTTMAAERAAAAGLSLWALAREDSVLLVNDGSD